jgi:hypothetical protein
MRPRSNGRPESLPSAFPDNPWLWFPRWGATNALIAIAEQAASGQLILAIRGVEALRERHLEVAGELLGHDDDAADVVGELGATFDELAALAEALSVLGHATTRSLDAIAAKGNCCHRRLSSLHFGPVESPPSSWSRCR